VTIAAALLVLLAAPRPDWVDGMPAAFPRDRFVVAVGTADDRAAAELRARAGIAAFFDSRVAAVARVEESEGHATENGLELRVASVSARQEVTAATAKLLEGAEIADAWTDAGGRSWALAVLDRARATDALRGRLAEVDAEVASLAARLGAEGARFERARLAHRIVSAAARRPPIIADLAVLDPSAAQASPAGVARARAAAERALSEVGVAVRVAGESAGPVGAAATRAIVGTGMRAVAAGAPHDLATLVDVEHAPAALDGAWTVVRLTARVRVLEGAGAEAVVTFVETAKGTSGRAEEAGRRAGEALAARVEERLQEELKGRLEGR